MPEPHAVHVKPSFITEDQSYYDDDGELHKKTARVRVQEVMQCPDCGRGLSSRGFDLACLQRNHNVQACHEGCVVACGGDE